MGSNDRKQTPSERQHEALMQALSRVPREPECAVDLTLNAKGDVQIAVAVRGPDVAEVGAAAQGEFDRLRSEYPRTNGGETK